MEKKTAPERVADGIWWLGTSSGRDFIGANTYLVYRDGMGILIDPGPVSRFQEIRGALLSLARLDEISAMVISDIGPDSCASVPLWESIGFKGSIIAHWQTALLLPAYGIMSRILSVSKLAGEEYPDFLGIRTVPLPYLPSAGSMATFDPLTATLFSGKLFGAAGKKLSLFADDGYDQAMTLYHEHTMPSTPMLLSALERVAHLGCARVCPLSGSVIDGFVPRAMDALRTVQCGKLDRDVSDFEAHVAAEIDSLRKQSFRLQEGIVMTEDGRLRDPLTELYTAEYLDQYLPMFFANPSGGALAYIRLDQMKSYNNEFGFAAGNEAIAVLARAVMENRREDVMVFRATGPAVSLCVPGESGALEEISRIQRSISKSGSFKRDVSTSVAIAFVAESSDAVSLLALSRERSRLLDGMGPGSLCSSSPSGREKRVGCMVIVENDPLFLAFLSSFFSSRNFEVKTARDGSEALEIINSSRPALVLSEVNVPQYDAFQIRERMNGSTDLKNIPLIAMSAVKDEKSVRRALGAGIRHFLRKPLMMAELEGLVRLVWEDTDVSL